MLKEWLKAKYACCLCLEITDRRLCIGCEEDFLSAPLNPCYCCGLPQQHPTLRCGECISIPPVYDQTYSPFLYDKPLSDIMLRFKEKNDGIAGEALAQLLSEKIQQLQRPSQLNISPFASPSYKYPLPDYVTAVPLHWKKRWQRGFNHAEIFCQRISKDLNIPIYRALKRNKEGRHDQKILSRKQRIHAMKNMFVANKSLTGKHVGIIDDVMTTGATVNDAARALKKAGAKYVSVWVLARTPPRASR